MFKVQIIGSGQLGSRHLQALKNLNTPLDITVSDPSNSSLEVAKSRYLEAAGTHHKATFQNHIQTDGDCDLVIVASSSLPRRKILEELLEKTSVKYMVLEKILFPNKSDYYEMQNLIEERKVKTWVNCCMRLMDVYQQINKELNGSAMNLTVNGSQFGLITNAIHYVDYICHLQNSSNFQLNTDGLLPEPIASKRQGYLEWCGTLTGVFQNGSTFGITSFENGNLPVSIDLSSSEKRFLVRESAGKMTSFLSKDNYAPKESDIKIPYQSQLTAIMAEQILKTDSCSLTPFSESCDIHLKLLSPIGELIKKHGLKSNVDFPFT